MLALHDCRPWTNPLLINRLAGPMTFHTKWACRFLVSGVANKTSNLQQTLTFEFIKHITIWLGWKHVHQFQNILFHWIVCPNPHYHPEIWFTNGSNIYDLIIEKLFFMFVTLLLLLQFALSTPNIVWLNRSCAHFHKRFTLASHP